MLSTTCLLLLLTLALNCSSKTIGTPDGPLDVVSVSIPPVASHHRYDCSLRAPTTAEEFESTLACPRRKSTASEGWTILPMAVAKTLDQHSIFPKGPQQIQIQPIPRRQGHSCVFSRIFRWAEKQSPLSSSYNTPYHDPSRQRHQQQEQQRQSHHRHHHHNHPHHRHTPRTAFLDAFLLNPGSLMLACVALVFSLTALLSWAARTMADRVRYQAHGEDEKVTTDEPEAQEPQVWREKTSFVV